MLVTALDVLPRVLAGELPEGRLAAGYLARDEAIPAVENEPIKEADRFVEPFLLDVLCERLKLSPHQHREDQCGGMGLFPEREVSGVGRSSGGDLVLLRQLDDLIIESFLIRIAHGRVVFICSSSC